ncbi:MAG TPA: prolyl oligopeptidase family serine peptidase [Terriglobales bacterium]|nr:prolyl oligopeptidase family serine peptidase [Terriglobales bacterium]
MIPFRRLLPALLAGAAVLAPFALGGAAQSPGGFSIEQVMDSPFPTFLTASSRGAHVAWITDLRGVHNVFVADGPAFAPRQVTHYSLDDGQPLVALRLSPDGKTVVFARGSEHNSLGDTADPDSSVEKPEQDVWSVRDGGTPKLLGEMGCSGEGCEDIQMSPDGQWVVWPARQTLWIAPTDGSAQAKAMTWSQGNNVQPQWSPDSKRVAFVSQRVGHALIAIYTVGGEYLQYVAPSVDRDSYPRWSPDGSELAFVRERGLVRNTAPPDGPEPADAAPAAPAPHVQLPRWELWVADTHTLQAHRFWQSGTRPEDALYRTNFDEAFQVGAGHRVLFSSEMDGWNHLYSVSDQAAGDSVNQAALLTPGDFETENVVLEPGGQSALFTSNQDDIDRRHIWRVNLAGGNAPVAVTSGATMEWTPVITADGKQILCLGSTATSPAMPYKISASGQRSMLGALPADFPSAQLVTPRQVIFPSTDGLQIHGQLFEPAHAAPGPRPTLIFVHGGSRRQMMLGFHYMDYYHNAYAENQYLTSRGFNVLSINYRTGTMYGHAFRMAPHTGRAGGKEYDDVVAAARYLQTLPEVDPHKIGIWGGSYGGYLTAMALSHNSDIFSAGVDFHGVHDWSTIYAGGGPPPAARAGGRGGAGNGAGRGGAGGNAAQAAKLAFDSSPDAYVEDWRSPVLLIQGDDDRNVDFSQMIDLVGRLRAQQVPFEQMVLPDEIHGFLRWGSWVRAYAATAEFFHRVLEQDQKIATTN